MKNAILIHSTTSDGCWSDLLYSKSLDFTEYPLLLKMSKKDSKGLEQLEYNLHKYVTIPKSILKDLRRYDCLTFDLFEPLNDIGVEICKYFQTELASYETIVYSNRSYFKGDEGIVCQYVFQQNSDNGVNSMNF